MIELNVFFLNPPLSLALMLLNYIIYSYRMDDSIIKKVSNVDLKYKNEFNLNIFMEKEKI